MVHRRGSPMRVGWAVRAARPQWGGCAGGRWCCTARARRPTRSCSRRTRTPSWPWSRRPTRITMSTTSSTFFHILFVLYSKWRNDWISVIFITFHLFFCDVQEVYVVSIICIRFKSIRQLFKIVIIIIIWYIKVSRSLENHSSIHI